MPAVTLVVAKQSGENTVSDSGRSEAAAEGDSATLPKDVQTQVIGDQSVFIEAAVDSIKHHLVEGSFFASIIIFMFLANWRTTLIAAIAIPTSIISTFALMAAMGFTLNQITMLALTLMVGIVIDDAIIVLENIYRFIEEKGMPPLQAAIEGTKGDRPGGDGDHALAAGGVSAGGLHGRHCGPVHEFLRLHVGVRDCGFAAGFVHADADVVLALYQAPKHEAGRACIDKRIRLFPVAGRALYAHAEVVDGASEDRDCRIQRSDDAEHCAAVHVRRARTFCRPTINRNSTCWCGRRKALRWPRRRRWRSGWRSRFAALPGVEHTLMTAGGGADASVNNASIYVKLTDIDQRSVSQQDLMQQTRALLKTLSGRDPHGRGTGEHDRRQPEQRGCAVFHSGSGPGQAGEVLGRAAGEDEEDSGRGGRGLHSAQRQAGSAAGDRPAARGRSGRFGAWISSRL